MTDRIDPNQESTSEPAGISSDIDCYRYVGGKWQLLHIPVPREMAFTLFINGHELVNILCTPVKLNQLALGYLFNQGIISEMGDVALMRVCEDDSLADITLKKADFILPDKRVLTSGCGGGVSFESNLEEPPIVSDFEVDPQTLILLMNQMLDQAELYNRIGGIHTSAISDGQAILAIGEDIGRHNTLDKIAGECLLRKITTTDRILLTTGRISSEMVRKSARMRVPIVASLTSPTERAVFLARELGMTLAGYVRGDRLQVYAGRQRLK